MCEIASRSFHAALAALLVVASTSACSGEGDDDDAASVQCSALQPDHIVASSTVYDGAPPPAEGGVVSEGSYRLTAYTVYTSSNGMVLPKCNALADLLALSNGGFQHAVGCYFEADNPETRLGAGTYSGSYFASGTEFSFSNTCPSQRVETFAYSVEQSNLRMLVTDTTGSLTTELVWTLE